MDPVTVIMAWGICITIILIGIILRIEKIINPKKDTAVKVIKKYNQEQEFDVFSIPMKKNGNVILTSYRAGNPGEEGNYGIEKY